MKNISKKKMQKYLDSYTVAETIYATEKYIELLERRREEVLKNFEWSIPDVLWDWLMDGFRECAGAFEQKDPMIVVDNAIVNGDWGDFDNYKHDKETDAAFVRRVKNDALFIDKKERLVCFSI